MGKCSFMTKRQAWDHVGCDSLRERVKAVHNVHDVHNV